MKRKGLFFLAVCLIVAINFAGFSISSAQSKVTMTIIEEEEGPCCWSVTDSLKGASVLRCVLCTYQADHTSHGTHDGHCKNTPTGK